MDVYRLIDPQLRPFINVLPPEFSLITRENIGALRSMITQMAESMPVPECNVIVTERDIDTKNGQVKLFIFEPHREGTKPALLWMHGGGYILGAGDDYMGKSIAEIAGCTVISVDYRLAPEHPFPAAPEDCHAALLWVAKNCSQLSIDPERIAIGGESAGGGMAAGVALMNRDRNGPALAFQLLMYPMIDNLHHTPSGMIEDYPIWSRQTSLNAWEMYLNGAPGKSASPYAAASRATDLSGLPPTYLCVGALDLFRDENIDYMQRLMGAGVPGELAVYPGVFHGANFFAPDAHICKKMQKNLIDAVKVVLDVDGDYGNRS